MIQPLSSAVDPAVVGGKAARLGQLLAAGFPVPDGFVIPVDAVRAHLAGMSPADPHPPPLGDELRAAAIRACDALGGPVAVRSSAVAEDLADASFAGQYESVLDVEGPAAFEAAVLRCLASARSERVEAYLAQTEKRDAGMAVLVQRMVPARAAGVAFTADPVTGERDVVVISAVAGLGERLVGGEADGELWEVGPAGARRRREGPSAILSEADAARVAALARAVAGGVPTDVEWAFDGQDVRLLQARPMTGLPDPVTWESPLPGGWVRNFRLGEWIGAPVSPLFRTWLLPALEGRLHAEFEGLFGIRMPSPSHVIVNGWYFYGLNAPRMTLGALWTTLRNLGRWRQMAAVTPPVAHLGFDSETERWRRDLLPALQGAVDDAARRVETVPPAELPALADALIAATGAVAASILGVAGYAAKAEWKLGLFWNEHLASVDGSWIDLVAGGHAEPALHDVEGLDWMFPTLGERGPLPPGPSAEARARVDARRASTGAAARAALPPRQLARFETLLAEASRAHAVRQEQTGLFTLAWPTLRRVALRLGAELARKGAIATANQVFFVERSELEAWLEGRGAPIPVDARKALWERQSRLVPPLVVGELTGMFKQVFAEMEAFLHHEEHDAPDALRGMPGSPGRVTGPARVIRSVDELDRLKPGEILVAPVTTPGWTLAFGRAAAIVTDTGSVASHASIVAREHGIPAVVGTGCATARIVDGQRVTVDGARGVVRLGG